MDLNEVLIPAVIFGAIGWIIKILAEARTRNLLIRSGKLDESAKNLWARPAHHDRLSNLKWGLVLAGIGLAFLLRQLNVFYMTDEGTVGLMFVFAGIAFLVYFWLAPKDSGSDKHHSTGAGGGGQSVS